MVGVLSSVAALDLLQEVPELGLIHAELTEHASLFEEVEGQHRQRGPWSGISKSKDVELPVVFCVLQAPKAADVFPVISDRFLVEYCSHSSMLHMPCNMYCLVWQK